MDESTVSNQFQDYSMVVIDKFMDDAILYALNFQVRSFCIIHNSNIELEMIFPFPIKSMFGQLGLS